MVTAAQVIAVARAEVGYREGRSSTGRANNVQKYSPTVPSLEWSQAQAWCQTFQSWVFQQAGAKSLAPVTASCFTACSWFKQRRRFSEYPAVGAQVFFGPSGSSHVGLVYAYDDTYAYTIEGNTNATGSAEGDGVYLKKRLRRDPYLHGYGYPDYDGGIVSADPAWRSRQPGTRPEPTPPPSPTPTPQGKKKMALVSKPIPAVAGDDSATVFALVPGVAWLNVAADYVPPNGPKARIRVDVSDDSGRWIMSNELRDIGNGQVAVVQLPGSDKTRVLSVKRLSVPTARLDAVVHYPEV